MSEPQDPHQPEHPAIPDLPGVESCTNNAPGNTKPDGSAYTAADFDFALPPALIAQHPAERRSGSRLLDGRGEGPVDRMFSQLPALLAPGDLLVVNPSSTPE